MHHWVGVVFALFIGISVIAPQLIFRTDPRYQGIELMGMDAEEHYIARVNEIYKGNLGLGNTFLTDKDKPYLQPPLGEILQTAVGKILFLNAPDGIVASKFIFPFLMALVLYALAFTVSRSRTAALIGTASAIVGHLLMSGVGPWLDLIRGVLPVGSYTIFSRPINPQISSLLMFAALIVLYRGFFARTVPRWWEVGVVGVLTGASLYISPYTFTFLGGLIGLSCVWFFVTRDYTRAVRTLYTGIVALVLLIPFCINYIELHTSEGFAELAMRQGLVTDYRPILSIWLLLMLIGVVFLWPKVYKQSRTFFILMVAVLWILTNQHVLTGFILHPSHYHWYITKPLLGVIIGMYTAFLLWYFFKHYRFLRIGSVAVILFVLLYNSPFLHIRWYRENPDPPVVAAQAYAPALDTLNTIEGAQTVWADIGISSYVSIYTKHSAPNNPLYVIYYLNPQIFYENSMFLRYRLAGETPATILGTILKDRVTVSERLFGLYYRQSTGYSASIPDEVLEELAGKYRVFYVRPFADVFKELGITIVVAPAQEKAVYDRIPALHLFASPEGYRVYTVAQ